MIVVFAMLFLRIYGFVMKKLGPKMYKALVETSEDWSDNGYIKEEAWMYKYEMHIHSSACSRCASSAGLEFVDAAKQAIAETISMETAPVQ